MFLTYHHSNVLPTRVSRYPPPPVRVITLVFTRKYPYSNVINRYLFKILGIEKRQKKRKKNIRQITRNYGNIYTTHNYGKIRAAFFATHR